MKHQKNSKKESGMKIQKGSKSVKRTILGIVFMAFSVCMTQGQDPVAFTGDVTLSTQTQIDNFNYSSISGNLNVRDGLSTDFITNIDNLNSLTNVGGYVFISSTNSLTSLSGLDNLTSIGGLLAISANNLLTSLTGLENLSSIGGKLYIGVSTNEVSNPNVALVNYCAISGLVTSDITDGSGSSTNEYFVANNGYNPTYAEIQSAATCSLLGKIYTYSSTGSSSSGTALTLIELTAIGITGVVDEKLAAYNIVIAAKTDFTDPATDSAATLAELQALITFLNLTPIFSKVYTYSSTGSDSSGMALTLAELNSIGTGVIATNLTAYNTAIAAKTDFTDPATDSTATFTELQTLITSVNLVVLLRKIYVYSATGSGSTGTALTLAELNSTGVTGIIAANLAAYNTAIAAKTDFADPATDSVDTLAELQTLITSVNGPVVGLSEYSSKSLVRLSPNPAIGFVSFFGLSSEEDYVIYNTLGVAVQSGIVFSEEKIIIESLPGGLYFLKLGKLEVFKFLKE